MSTASYFRSPSLWLFLLVSPSLCAPPLCGQTVRANEAFQAGRADEAAALANSALASNPRDAQAHQLLCRIDYSQTLVESAVHECEAAVALAPNDSENQLWLARAYGMKAQRANMIAAFSLARKVKTAFEEAANLDPHSVAALSDLGDFYIAAPAVVGGGLDKAEELSQRMEALSAARAHRLLARVAEKKGDLTTAEAEFKKAVASGRSPDAYIDLGHFYQHQQRYNEAEAALKAAIHEDRTHDPVLVDAASILTATHRDSPLAEQLLREYLASPAKSEAAPAYKVHVQLGDLLAKDGDKDGARQEYDAALGLASRYPAARKALQSL
jgi:tetratricopeptide (TPR) repeat protein